ncbi:MAG: formylglycine-generating enzyme family protein [Deltaproteobacteria bacterium]|nr:formylglycine-generating enzyme family protein [Deltaproteobacteria bacterium]
MEMKTPADDYLPAVASSPAGVFAVVFLSDDDPGGGVRTLGRVFDADGTPRSGLITIDTNPAGAYSRPAIAMSAIGRFVVAWDKAGAGRDIYGRLFDSEGDALTGAFAVSTDADGDEDNPAAAMAADGSFAVAWHAADNAGDIHARRFYASGAPMGGPAAVNVPAEPLQNFPAASSNAAGDVIFVWASFGQDGSDYGVFARRTETRDLVWVPLAAGSFDMGCSAGDTGCGGDEIPRHAVTLSRFDITETEITQEQYFNVMGANPSQHTDCAFCPVDNVTWEDADEFCFRVGGYLPTEAEWEYAARAGTAAKHGCGADPACLDGTAWHQGNAGGATHEVALKTPNAFGLYDMMGNVWEWIADWYGAAYYAVSPENDPPGPDTGDYKVWRGGAYNTAAAAMRVSDRVAWWTTFHSGNAGFRCVRYTAPTTTSTTTSTTTTTIPGDDDTGDDDTGDDDTGDDDTGDDDTADDDTGDDDTGDDDSADDDTVDDDDDDAGDDDTSVFPPDDDDDDDTGGDPFGDLGDDDDDSSGGNCCGC